MVHPQPVKTLLQAGFVSVDEIDETLIVGFADRQFDTSQYFMLQRSLDPDDDDGVYLEHTDQAYGSYAKVSSCILYGEHIELTVDRRAAKTLETDTNFAVEFKYDEAMRHRLAAGLQRIFAGTACRPQILSP